MADPSPGVRPTDERTDDPAGWSGDDAVLLAAADQLVIDHRLDLPTWTALRARFDDEQLIELTLLAGHYAMLAGALNSFGTRLDGHEPDLGRAQP